MKIKELRLLSKEDMKTRLGELKKELIKHNAQIATGTIPKSPGQVKQTKKTIARILTILKEKEEKKEQSSEVQKEKAPESKKIKEALNG